MDGGNLVLVDGDICCYKVGFASNDQPWEICKARVDIMLVDILNNTDSDTMYGWLTEGTNNFRNKVAVTKPYKGNRKAPKPVHYDAIRAYLVEYHGFTMETTQEADDAIGIAHAEYSDWLSSDRKVIIASIDKDLLMIPGRHYNIKTGEVSIVTIEGARKNFYRQVLTGDNTDNIPGLKGIGPVKADRILIGDPAHYWIRVVEAYAERSEIIVPNPVWEVAELVWIRRDPTEARFDHRFQFDFVDDIYRRYHD